MFDSIARRFFGTANDRYVRGLSSVVDQINSLEKTIEQLTETELRSCTDKFRERIQNGETLDDILPEAFATVREAAKRSLGERPYDVQMIGAIILHRGMIAEMKTGEGKTLTITLAAYLNALNEKGVHIVTVNDYLAKRDSIEMGQIYNFLGLTSGFINNDQDDSERKKNYNCDITYATNSELGFDYLRDNMKFSEEQMVQRDHDFSIVDEIDSCLIDEARTPLVISGPSGDHGEVYKAINAMIPKFTLHSNLLNEGSPVYSIRHDHSTGTKSHRRNPRAGREKILKTSRSIGSFG